MVWVVFVNFGQFSGWKFADVYLSDGSYVECEGCLVVGCDHAPQAGVAQGF